MRRDGLICFRMIKNKCFPLFLNKQLNPQIVNNFSKIKWYNGKDFIFFDL